MKKRYTTLRDDRYPRTWVVWDNVEDDTIKEWGGETAEFETLEHAKYWISMHQEDEEEKIKKIKKSPLPFKIKKHLLG